jgi:hypothetical protein
MTPAEAIESAAALNDAPRGIITRTGAPCGAEHAESISAPNVVANLAGRVKRANRIAYSGRLSACCSNRAAAMASTSPLRPFTEPPISRTLRSAADVV